MDNLLNYLSQTEIKKLKMVEVKKGETIFFEHERCDYIGLIKKGEIRIISFLEDGREIVYNILRNGEMFGNNLIFSSDQRYRGDVIAYRDSKIFLITKDQMINLLKDNQEFLEAYLENQAENGKALNLKIKLLTFNNIEDRFLYYLQINKFKLRFKSITDLAKTLFVSREALSRLIHRLEKEDVIYIKDNFIVKTWLVDN